MKTPPRIYVAINALLYILRKIGKPVGFHKACKLLYFADKKHIAEYGAAILQDDCYCAMKYGPVPSEVYDLLNTLKVDKPTDELARLMTMYFDFQYLTNGSGNNVPHIAAKTAPDTNWLSESEIEALDYSVEEYKDFDFTAITNLSHEDPAWENAWNKAEANGKRSEIMQWEDIAADSGANAETQQHFIERMNAQKYLHEQNRKFSTQQVS